MYIFFASLLSSCRHWTQALKNFIFIFIRYSISFDTRFISRMFWYHAIWSYVLYAHELAPGRGVDIYCTYRKKLTDSRTDCGFYCCTTMYGTIKNCCPLQCSTASTYISFRLGHEWYVHSMVRDIQYADSDPKRRAWRHQHHRPCGRHQPV